MSEYKIMKNDDGVFRVKIYEPGPVGKKQDGIQFNEGHWLTDTDLMIAISGNHITQIMNFYSKADAHRGIADHLSKLETIKLMCQKTEHKAPEVSDTFKEV